jgi:hypothetical protein
MLLPHDVREKYSVQNERAVGICQPRSGKGDDNYLLVPVRNRTLMFHTIAVARSNVEVIGLHLLYFLFIYLYF